MFSIPKHMTERRSQLVSQNNDVKYILSMAESQLNNALKEKKRKQDKAHIETLRLIVMYWKEHLKANNYEKLMIDIIINGFEEQKSENIIKIASNLRPKFLNACAELCDLHSALVNTGRIEGFDDYSYMKLCKSKQSSVESFTELCDIINETAKRLDLSLPTRVILM